MVAIPLFCQKCEVRRSGMCKALKLEQLSTFGRMSSRRHYDSGRELQGQGEPIETFASVVRGVIKLTKVMADGRQQIVGLQFAPSFIGRPFGEESGVSVQAATGVDICAIPRAALEQLMISSPDAKRHLHAQAMADLEETRTWLLVLGKKSAEEKIASFIYLIAQHLDTQITDIVEFELPLTRQEIGDFLGLSIETVSRQITRLRSEKVIRVGKGRQVTIENLEHLARLAGVEQCNSTALQRSRKLAH